MSQYSAPKHGLASKYRQLRCNWSYDGTHDMFDGPIDENPVGVDGVFCQ